MFSHQTPANRASARGPFHNLIGSARKVSLSGGPRAEARGL